MQLWMMLYPNNLKNWFLGWRESSRRSKIANGLVLRQYKPICDLQSPGLWRSPKTNFSGCLGIWFLTVFASLFSQEEDCLCGTVTHDPFYAKAVFSLYEAIKNTPFVDLGNFPKSAPSFYSEEGYNSYEECYPFQGSIRWDGSKHTYWDSDFILGHNETARFVSSPFMFNVTKIPAKLERTLTLTDPDIITEDCLRQTHVFNLQKNYAAIPQVFLVLEKDIVSYCEEDELFLDARIRDLSNQVGVYENLGCVLHLVKRKTLLEFKKKARSSCNERLQFTQQKETEALAFCTQSLDWCIEHHCNPSAHLNRGLFYYLEGNTFDALSQIEAALKNVKNDDFEKITEEALHLKGQTELEAGLYADALLTLTALINRNPDNKKVYFERAEAYFELGRFDLSLEDYLASEIKPQPIAIDSIEMVSFSLGLAKGIVQGGSKAGLEFIPSLLSSLQGLGHGLWAFAQDPVQISQTFVQASQDCLQFIKDHTPTETLKKLVPELKELIDQWNMLDHEKRGEITGQIIGKYGVDIFAGTGIVKGMKVYRDLKQANNLLTFEALAISERNRSLIKLEAINKVQARQRILQHANLKIQWDKQGKHIEGHQNFQTKNKSILAHPDPQKLSNDFCGKGIRAGNVLPGTSGYQEIVDFGEFIGYWVNPTTGEKNVTSWGKIHYAKDGVHIVPTKPRR